MIIFYLKKTGLTLSSSKNYFANAAETKAANFKLSTLNLEPSMPTGSPMLPPP
jgi:hypothetical protein